MITVESLLGTLNYYKIFIIASSLLIFTIIVHLRGTKKNLALV